MIIDLVALAPGDDATITKARLLKADWCEQLAKKTRVFVSPPLAARAWDAPCFSRNCRMISVRVVSPPIVSTQRDTYGSRLAKT